MAVSATSMVAGFTLWSLMVRRRLYRDMGVTRSAKVSRRAWDEG